MSSECLGVSLSTVHSVQHSWLRVIFSCDVNALAERKSVSPAFVMKARSRFSAVCVEKQCCLLYSLIIWLLLDSDWWDVWVINPKMTVSFFVLLDRGHRSWTSSPYVVAFGFFFFSSLFFFFFTQKFVGLISHTLKTLLLKAMQRTLQTCHISPLRGVTGGLCDAKSHLKVTFSLLANTKNTPRGCIMLCRDTGKHSH